VRAAHCVGTPPDTPESVRPNKTVVVKRSAALSTDGMLFAQRLGRFCAERSAEYAASHCDLLDPSLTPQSPAPTPQRKDRGLAGISTGEAAGDGGGAVGAVGALFPEPAGDLAGLFAEPAGGSTPLHRRTTSFDDVKDNELAEKLDAAVADGRLAEEATNAAFQVAVFTSTLPRCVQTASFVQTTEGRPRITSALNPVDRGNAYGLDEEQFERQYPDCVRRMRADVRHTRFPGGESYADLLQRVEPFLIELEQQTCVLAARAVRARERWQARESCARTWMGGVGHGVTRRARERARMCAPDAHSETRASAARLCLWSRTCRCCKRCRRTLRAQRSRRRSTRPSRTTRCCSSHRQRRR
jgi:hypothetical protein